MVVTEAGRCESGGGVRDIRVSIRLRPPPPSLLLLSFPLAFVRRESKSFLLLQEEREREKFFLSFPSPPIFFRFFLPVPQRRHHFSSLAHTHALQCATFCLCSAQKKFSSPLPRSRLSFFATSIESLVEERKCGFFHEGEGKKFPLL